MNRNFLVVANHASHLDMGLVKVVLGDQGERLAALAARDYFFDTPLKRAYFENFTNLIPMDRHGSLRESLRLAGEALRQGYNLLIFPEGTRSATGELLEFKPTLGYLALTYGWTCCRMYLKGAYEALPKGAHVAQVERAGGPHRPGADVRRCCAPRRRAWRARRATATPRSWRRTPIRALAGGPRAELRSRSATVEDQRRALSSGGSES